MDDLGYISPKIGFDKSNGIRSTQKPREHIYKVGLEESSIIKGLGFLSVGSKLIILVHNN